MEHGLKHEKSEETCGFWGEFCHIVLKREFLSLPKDLNDQIHKIKTCLYVLEEKSKKARRIYFFIEHRTQKRKSLKTRMDAHFCVFYAVFCNRTITFPCRNLLSDSKLCPVTADTSSASHSSRPSLSYLGGLGSLHSPARPPSYLLTPVPCKQAIKNPAEAGLVLRGANHSLPSNSSSESIIKAASGAYSSESRILFIKSRNTCAAFFALPLRAMVHW